MAKTRVSTPAPMADATPAPKYVTPQDTSSRTPAVKYLGGSRSHYLYAVPNRFHLVDGRVVPILSKLSRTAGANDVAAQRQRLPGGGWRYVPDMSRAISKLEREGCAIIPFDVDASEGFPSYLQSIPGTGKVCHRLCSLVPGLEPLPPAAADWADWLCSLMERGIIPSPHPSQVSAVIEAKRKLSAQLAQSGETEASARLREEVDRALEALRPRPKPKPKPKRRVKPKTPPPKTIEVVDVLDGDPDG